MKTKEIEKLLEECATEVGKLLMLRTSVPVDKIVEVEELIRSFIPQPSSTPNT